MILINLLPHREEKRQQRKRAFFVGLGACAVGGAVIVGLWYSILGQMTSAQESRNAFLTAEIGRLDAQIKDIATLEAEIRALEARKQAVEDLQADRNVPVHLLNELVRQTPDGVYLSSIKQQGQIVAISGIAQTNERVSELLRNTAYNSPWLEKPELVEIKALTANPNTRDARRLFDFSMRVTIKRQQTVAAAAAASAAPAAVPAPGAAPAGSVKPAAATIPSPAPVTPPAPKSS